MQDSQLGSTRARIQRVALELFAERGYDKTSLRELAERLGMTKASLYYYFKSKDDIVRSLVDDLLAAVDEVVDWSREREPSPQNRRELIERYGEAVRGRGTLLRFLMENQPALRSLEAGDAMRERMRTLVDFVVDPADPLPVQLCGRMAFYALHGGPAIMSDVDATSEDIFDAACVVALSMLPDGDGDGPRPPA
ncbi:TetR/AcrR family transcriptional regulator [Jiangella ureilytica]|uniref:TetR/AcrR family transcriptional regulator n=1 Tax=Jiangella ureilytica TaxID=2530374 RepID=A0A4R4RJB7_9ACTN|nr:TetR/AcrR family transcriptional regulator [Jiangella ureilytica]TDC49049.1 TetR/AcrR family transcriptional regulator [Jiangella ureilytica]